MASKEEFFNKLTLGKKRREKNMMTLMRFVIIYLFVRSSDDKAITITVRFGALRTKLYLAQRTHYKHATLYFSTD